jgi:hypothetical protein
METKSTKVEEKNRIGAILVLSKRWEPESWGFPDTSSSL